MTMFDSGSYGLSQHDPAVSMPVAPLQPPPDARHAIAPPPHETAPLLSLGRYRSDSRLHRSNLTVDVDSQRRVEGLPLYLSIRVYSTSTPNHRALAGVQVDLCHCDSQGRYSASCVVEGSGHSWLRGHQYSYTDGVVMFQTIYPGWQPGRAVHIRLGARYYDRFGHASFTYATDLYFDDAVTDAVHAQAPYAAHGVRDTRNGDDAWFAERNNRQLRLRPTGDHSPGYLGEIELGLALAPSDADAGVLQRCQAY